MTSSVARTNSVTVMSSGSHAVAHAVKAARAEVITACPILPQTAIIERLSEFCVRGDLQARFIQEASGYSALADADRGSRRRRQNLYRDVGSRTSLDARNAPLGGGRSVADRDCQCQPRAGSALVDLGRPQ